LKNRKKIIRARQRQNIRRGSIQCPLCSEHIRSGQMLKHKEEVHGEIRKKRMTQGEQLMKYLLHEDKRKVPPIQIVQGGAPGLKK